MQPEFEEKSYEAAANGELRLASPYFYAPGQVAEGILGFDLASFQPATSIVWNYLQRAAPGGLRLLPNLWPTGRQPPLDVRLPSYIVSLIVQYKRAERMLRSNAGQYDHWQSEYFRFKLDEDQQLILERLEAAVQNHAVIRYGSPVFHLYDDLERHTLNIQVLANTNFVSPFFLTGHEAWTYVAPGTQGFANPEPQNVKTETWGLIEERLRGARQETTVLKHLHELASAITTNQLVRISKMPEAALSGLEPEQQHGLADLLTVSRVIGRLGSDWWMSVEPVAGVKGN
jgi:hypothetical protein